MNFDFAHADRDGGFRREILETDKCDWCKNAKAIITDGAYVYCSEGCKELFADNAHEAIEQAIESNFNKE